MDDAYSVEVVHSVYDLMEKSTSLALGESVCIG